MDRNMASSSRVQLILGAVATAALAFVSFFVVRRRLAAAGKNSSVLGEGLRKEQGGGDASTDREKPAVSQSCQLPQELQHEETYTDAQTYHTGGLATSSEYGEKRGDNFAHDGHDQTSFIVFDNGEEATPPDNGQNKKKSDRSSDESSYDVIDDDAAEEGEGSERDEGSHALPDDGAEHKELDDRAEHKQLEIDKFLDSNETSMVIIGDLEQSGSKSESSFYASADEHVESRQGDDKQGELLDVPEEDAPGADSMISVSSSYGEYREESIEVVEAPVHVDQTQVSASADDPIPVSEQSPAESPAVQETLNPEADSTQGSPPVADVDLGASYVTEVLSSCQDSPSTVSKESIQTLVGLLNKNIPELHSTVLNCVLRVAAFTQNVKTLRESGCLRVVAHQVMRVCKTFSQGKPEDEMLLNSLCQVLTNLTLDPKSQSELEDTVPCLVDLLVTSDREASKLSVLRPLINFSSQANFHSHFTRAVQDLYTLLDTGSQIARVQSVKVLVNLSLGEDMVPHLLAAKAPSSLLELLDLPTSMDLTLRTVTLLANIKVAMHRGNVSLASLPVEDKAASPETMYTALHGASSVPSLRSKVFRLTRHNNEDVSHQASRLHQQLQQTSQ